MLAFIVFGLVAGVGSMPFVAVWLAFSTRPDPERRLSLPMHHEVSSLPRRMKITNTT